MMESDAGRPSQEEFLLYYRSREDVETYRDTPVGVRLQWLQDQMEFLDKVMPAKAKAIRDKMFGHPSALAPHPYETRAEP
jgi:hypothetical protein